ncbi:hypothetical protein EPUS_02366 [Endocarpon pusillum Z07020]|uniref:Zinc-ribbon 15 domain-containing protein n=1 Tax=Endocarpon pusillum (strain Z07020 / HMAS-L-300199) TaxID=1263415 RepID=U1HP67_ENDPU|nr:uncharacterized protein EPUS_02366 [Endocarpon pusillum Z07020]ERF70844.1 hypothetical protein EPUS_02366 [Endocarpon pusillum Z07020]
MAFCIIMGTHPFTKQMEEYRGQQFRCNNCGNVRAFCQKSWTWFTVCWIPVIPFSAGWHKDVYCPICRVTQDLGQRPDITSGQGTHGQAFQQGAINGGYGGPPQQQAHYK